MNNKNTITILCISIALLSVFATSKGIFSDEDKEPKTITSVRGHVVKLYGKGIYHHMSAEVAPQGIAQDIITLFIAIPLLLISLASYRKGSLRGKVILTGSLAYFLVTYLFFTMMAMYNQMFLAWVILLSLSFHAFYLAFESIGIVELQLNTKPRHPVRFVGGFLMFCAVSIGLLWLSIVIPPAMEGTVPLQTEHYTTLVVQALDLSIALPVAFIGGLMLYKKKPFGYKLAAVYTVFLSILMTALSAKVIAMALLGYNVIPVIFIIPAFNILSAICAVLSIRNIHQQK
jgi:hypothetical protein